MGFAVRLSEYSIPNFPVGSTFEYRDLKPLFTKVVCTSEFSKEHIESRKELLEGITIEVLAEKDLPEQILAFLRRWNTQGLSELELDRERKVWDLFFQYPRSNQISRNILRFCRPGQPSKIYEISLLDRTDGHRASSIFAQVYPKEQRVIGKSLTECEMEFLKASLELKENNLLIKKSVELSGIMHFFEKKEVSFLLNTSLSFSNFCQKHFTELNFLFMDPVLPKLFSVAPSISQMDLLINYGGIPVAISMKEGKSE